MELLVCDYCGQQFSSPKVLCSHQERYHSSEKSPCAECEKTFESKTSLKAHRRQAHAATEIVCKKCGKKFRVPVTNKCHIIFEHVSDFVKDQEKPLGEFSEQEVGQDLAILHS